MIFGTISDFQTPRHEREEEGGGLERLWAHVQCALCSVIESLFVHHSAVQWFSQVPQLNDRFHHSF